MFSLHFYSKREVGADLFALLGVLCVPILITVILGTGLLRRVNVYDAFVEGAKDGLVTLFKIFPSLLGLITSVAMLRASGALDLLCSFLKPITSALGVPSEVVPLMLMRPVSGSGALAVVTDIFKNLSPDSFAGLCASVMMGSTETTFYTIAVYYGSVGITKIRHTLKAALIADLVGMIGSVLAVRLFLM